MYFRLTFAYFEWVKGETLSRRGKASKMKIYSFINMPHFMPQAVKTAEQKCGFYVLIFASLRGRIEKPLPGASFAISSRVEEMALFYLFLILVDLLGI